MNRDQSRTEPEAHDTRAPPESAPATVDPPILPSGRIRLREFTLDDVPAVAAYRSDRRYGLFYPDDLTTGVEARRMVERFVAGQSAPTRYRFQWAVVLDGTGELIGNCGIRKPDAGSALAEIGFELSPDHWGNGYATEFAGALLRFGFETLRLHRITAHCIAENRASARVLEKVGMSLEGRLREDEWMRERWWDVLLFGILEREWHEARERRQETGTG